MSGCICLLFFPVSLFSPYKSCVCGPCHHIPSTSRQVAPLRGTSFPGRGKSDLLVPSLSLRPGQNPSPTLPSLHMHKRKKPWPLRSLGRGVYVGDCSEVSFWQPQHCPGRDPSQTSKPTLAQDRAADFLLCHPFVLCSLFTTLPSCGQKGSASAPSRWRRTMPKSYTAIQSPFPTSSVSYEVECEGP